ncbi:MAG: sel1 repeat family protein, partial [Gammaproteobacteria bacterium]|nr:sel1 repeat family protein [Gammaproteobacteria bacterium]
MMKSGEQLDMELSSGIAAFEGKHFAIAAQSLSPLADQGVPEAQYRMAIMAQNGLGMTVNQLLAYKYMRASAEAGLAIAQHGLGFMYLEGECVERNGQQAVYWFKRAAEQGLVGSQTTLGMMYEQGQGVE